MRRFLLALWLLSMAFLTGCSDPVEFAEPISPPGEVEYDTRLVGVWIARMDYPQYSSRYSAPPIPVNRNIIALNVWPDSDKLHILRFDGIGIGESPDDEIGWASGNLYPSAIGGRIYYNIHVVASTDKGLANTEGLAGGYLILRLVLAGDDSLLVQGMRYDAIEPRHIAGGEKLAALLRDTPNDRLFVDIAMFHRLDVKPPGWLLWQGLCSWAPPIHFRWEPD